MQNTLNKLKKNKRAVAEVVSTTLIILLAVAAVALMAFFINRLVSTPQLSPAFSCYDWSLSPPIAIQKACYNVQSGDVEITILRRGSNDQIDSLNFALNGNEVSNWQCGATCGTCSLPLAGQAKTYYSNLPNFDIRNVSVSISANKCQIAKKQLVSC